MENRAQLQTWGGEYSIAKFAAINVPRFDHALYGRYWASLQS